MRLHPTYDFEKVFENFQEFIIGYVLGDSNLSYFHSSTIIVNLYRAFRSSRHKHDEVDQPNSSIGNSDLTFPKCPRYYEKNECAACWTIK